MEKQLLIKYKWTCDEGITIPTKHNEALEEDALNRIFDMITKGYYQGELSTSIRYSTRRR